MPRPARPSLRRVLGRATAGALAAVLATTGLALLTSSEDAATGATTVNTQQVAAKKKKENVVTPGDFTGFGFDQCLTPNQKAMDRWFRNSPFLAVGVYISGDSRACRNQPNLTPTWVSTQLARGWRLLPITLGPQASCQPRFPRYKDDFRISSKRATNGSYSVALQQGKNEAVKSVGAAQALGISAGSTLWYDLEGFDLGNTKCRESALSFLSGWTQQIRSLGYVSGVYSSAGSGIKALDDARVNRPKAFTLPDQIWIARWDGKATVTTPYVRSDGWMPHARVKQYQGGHDETWGKVRINIDRNFLDLGRGSVAVPETHCGKVQLAFSDYQLLRPPTANRVPEAAKMKALQCLLKEQGLYRGRVHGRYTAATTRAMNTWQSAHGLTVSTSWSRRAWVTLLAAGRGPILKFGSASPDVRRLQRALKATRSGTAQAALKATGVFDGRTDAALRAWQKRVGITPSGVSGSATWAALRAGER